MAAQTYCTRCPIMCGMTGTVAITETPKDSKTPMPVTLIASKDVIDLVQHCKENYVKP